MKIISKNHGMSLLQLFLLKNMCCPDSLFSRKQLRPPVVKEPLCQPLGLSFLPHFSGCQSHWVSLLDSGFEHQNWIKACWKKHVCNNDCFAYLEAWQLDIGLFGLGLQSQHPIRDFTAGLAHDTNDALEQSAVSQRLWDLTSGWAECGLLMFHDLGFNT